MNDPVPVDGSPTTLKQTFSIAQQLIGTWSGSWVVWNVASTDVGDSANTTSGSDGRRFSWIVETFGSTGEQRGIRITGGKVTQVVVGAVPVTGGTPKLLTPPSPPSSPLSPPQVDSDIAVSTALQYVPGLSGVPSDPKSVGLHFSYAFNSDIGKSIIKVAGSVGANTVSVSIDADAGVVTSAVKRVFAAQLQFSSDGGLNWSLEEDLPGVPLAVASDGAGTAFMAVLANSTISVVAGDGVRWQPIVSLPATAGSWVRGLAYCLGPAGPQLAIAAEDDGLWMVSLNTGTVLRDEVGLIAKVASGPDGILHAIHVNAPGSTEHLVRGPDGAWAIQPGDAGLDRFFTVGHRVVASNPTLGPNPLGISALLAAAGSDKKILASSSVADVVMSDDGGRNWHPTTLPGKGAIVQVQVSPDWDQSGVALAGEFRGPIWRTADGGASWSPVFRADGETGSVLFLSPSRILAIVGEQMIWLPI